MPRKSADDLKFEAEDDARTLAQAEAVRSDAMRLRRAAKAARRLLKEKEAEVRRMRKVATRKTATRKR